MSTGNIQLAAVELTVMDNSQIIFDGTLESKNDPQAFRELDLIHAYNSDELVCE